MTRIAFFVQLPFHEPILRPIHDALPAGVHRMLGGDRRAIVRFGPDVLVLTSHVHLEYFRHHLPAAVLVNVRHGLIGKRLIERLPGRASARTFDAVCVGDATAVATYEREGGRPGEFWLTGYPQLDPLFRRDPPAPVGVPGRPTVLYAPTWNLGLSSAALLGGRLVELIRRGAPGATVIIKPHPVIGQWHPRWMARWEHLAATEPGVVLVADTHADVARYMLAADCLVSDASSAIFEFLALDRPIVLVTNPRHRADPAFDAEDIAWRWRDVGEEVHDPEALPRAVAAALADPPARAARRRHYARLLFGELTDGRNHARVAERLLAAAAGMPAAGGPRRAPRRPPIGWWWHDARIRIAMSPLVRRLAYAPLEPFRLWVRGRRVREQAPGAPALTATRP